jgi:hypothetical protein
LIDRLVELLLGVALRLLRLRLEVSDLRIDLVPDGRGNRLCQRNPASPPPPRKT